MAKFKVKESQGLHLTLSSLTLGDPVNIGAAAAPIDGGGGGGGEDLMDELFGTLSEVLVDEESGVPPGVTEQQLVEPPPSSAGLHDSDDAHRAATHEVVLIQSAQRKRSSVRHVEQARERHQQRIQAKIEREAELEAKLSMPKLPEIEMKELGLQSENFELLENTYRTLHLHTDGNFDIDGCHNFFRIGKSPWSERVFHLLDSDRGIGTVHFLEWISFVTHICTAKDDGLARMVFTMYDPEQSGECLTDFGRYYFNFTTTRLTIYFYICYFWLIENFKVSF
jgi:hypothetical protein